MCNLCSHQWVSKTGKKIDYKRYYREYLFGRKTLKNITENINISVKTLRKYFDNIEVNSDPKLAPNKPINCVLDATFFGREYGYLSFHDTTQIIYAKEIQIESLVELKFCIDNLVEAGYKFKSFTLDGNPGFAPMLKNRFPGVPVQMCIFHQKAIIRRYITNVPKNDCGRDLKQLMAGILQDSEDSFADKFLALQKRHKSFLYEKNNKGNFKHKKLRSAVRSIKTHLSLLFEYQRHRELNIPHTTNHIEGAFSHLKEKINIHLGMALERKKQGILFLLMKEF